MNNTTGLEHSVMSDAYDAQQTLKKIATSPEGWTDPAFGGKDAAMVRIAALESQVRLGLLASHNAESRKK
jgi:hypothetical protein